MRLSLSFSGFGPLDATLRSATAAEDAELDGVWMCEHLGFTDAVVPAAAALSSTSGIEVGIVGSAPVSRHPALFAMELADLATIAPGRVRVQVGLGDALMVATLGADHRRGLRTAEEFVAVLRRLLAGEVVDGEYAGHRFVDFRLFAPPPVAPPIDLMAVRPRMLELAARVADGVSLTAGASLEYLASTVDSVVKTLVDAGRDRSSFRISATVLGAVAADEDTAAAMIAPILAGFAPAGFATTAPDVFTEAELARGALPMTTAKVSALALVATPETFADVLGRFAATGIDEVALGLVNPPEEIPALLRGLRVRP
ncbi:LLM class flavin-dependent oxidoreductase [Pseudonocardia sp. TRM90224]|uniref:LLM class flavin-dependent oxidoreductase n=1 Tax=Pseudonocardia sp. TRM90224 TaxID=2812678 RepID=UPI001E3F3164|nr:LLM class flavin-dependent oxidoreductase [Pseudonocardia sp. TRM90224]